MRIVNVLLFDQVNLGTSVCFHFIMIVFQFSYVLTILSDGCLVSIKDEGRRLLIRFSLHVIVALHGGVAA